MHAARAERASFDRLCRVVEISARGSDVDDVVSSARAEIIGMFDLEDCVFETADSATARSALGIDGFVGDPRPGPISCSRRAESRWP